VLTVFATSGEHTGLPTIWLRQGKPSFTTLRGIDHSEQQGKNMRIRSITLTDYPPIGKLAISDMGSTIVIAGANGSGKTRLMEAIVATLKGNPVMDMVIEATRPEEKADKYFNGNEITVEKGSGNKILKNYMLSRRFGTGRYVGSLVQIDSNRTVESVSYSHVNWLGGDPDDAETASNFYFSPFRNRWQDFLNYIHQKTAARGKKIADAVMSDPERKGADWLDTYPAPLDKYKKIFREALPGKELLDIDPKSPREFRYLDQSGQTLDFKCLSSGEKEVIKVLFDVARKEIRHSVVIVDEPDLHLHPTLAFQLIESLTSLGDHTNQFIFLTHSSDLITTYYSSGDVYFIDPTNDGNNQAHRLLDLAADHQDIIPLIGQNIGLFAVGKKLVFVEGEDSSIDRLAYQKIAQTVDGEIRIIPAGSVFNIMTLNKIEQQIRNTIFGIDLYMVIDRDGLNDKQVSQLEANNRIRCLKRRHIENYFLDSEVLQEVAEKLYLTSKYPEITKDYLDERLNEIAKASIGYNIYKNIKETLSVSYFLESPRVSGLEKMSIEEIKQAIRDGIAANITSLSDRLSPDMISTWLDKDETRMKQMLSDGTWVNEFRGKYMFHRVCSDVLREDPIKVRHAYVDVALANHRSAIHDLVEIFKGM